MKKSKREIKVTCIYPTYASEEERDRKMSEAAELLFILLSPKPTDKPA